MQSLYFPPRVGGLESHVYYLCKGLVERGNSVTVITSRTEPSSARHELLQGIRIHRRWCPGKNILGWMVTTFLATPLFVKLARGADILHAHTFPSAISGIVSKWISKRRLVVTIHTSHFLRRAGSAFWRPVFRRIIQNTDYLLTASRSLQRACRDIAPGVRIGTYINSVDTQIFRKVSPAIKHYDKDKYIIVCPARLVPVKGVEYLLSCIPIVQRELSVEVYILGSGPLRRRLESLSRSLNLTNCVHFLGDVPNYDMPGYLSSADVVVVPSVLEGTSMAILEAMACEQVVVASNVGGSPDIVNHETGALFESGNVAELAERITSLLRKDNRAEMGQAARKRVVSNWSLDKLCQEHEKIYGSLINA